MKTTTVWKTEHAFDSFQHESKIEVNANAISGNAFAVDLQDLRSAVYLLQIITPSGRQTVKLVKE